MGLIKELKENVKKFEKKNQKAYQIITLILNILVLAAFCIAFLKIGQTYGLEGISFIEGVLFMMIILRLKHMYQKFTPKLNKEDNKKKDVSSRNI